jgi:hypothetical protein
MVAYHGSFWVDANSMDLMRLEVEADQIPPSLHLARAGDSVDYMRADIGGNMFLLPQAAELLMTDDNNSDSRNRTSFSGCRQYLGESTLLFSDPVPDAAPKAAPQWTELPDALLVDLNLDTSISLSSAAVGDPITGILERPIKKNGTTLVPKGALLHGRITLLRSHSMPQGGYVVGLRFMELESGLLHSKVRLELEHIVAATTNITLPAAQSDRFIEREKVREFKNPAYGGVLLVRGNTGKLARGLRMQWRTVPQTSEDQQ